MPEGESVIEFADFTFCFNAMQETQAVTTDFIILDEDTGTPAECFTGSLLLTCVVSW